MVAKLPLKVRVSQKKQLVKIVGITCYQLEVVSSCQYCGDFGGQGATIEIMGDGEETTLSVISPCRIGVPSSNTFNMR